MERLFANTWVYVAHDSQVPKPGDYFGTTIGAQPVLMVRHEDGSLHVLYNRCPHKGTRITTETSGNTGQLFRCPYHPWSFRTDGSLAELPLPEGYDNTRFTDSAAARGLTPVRHIHNYRCFVSAKMAAGGADFATFFGDSLSSIDNMVDRSPAGRLEVAGGLLRYMHNCNWKMSRHRDRPMEARRRANPEADGGGDLRAVHGAIRVLQKKWVSAPGKMTTATPKFIARSTQTTRRYRIISSAWSPPMVKPAPGRSWVRTGII
ncbi:Rieske 2Fe-2S domain-containing protein [Rhodopila sp.]|uniref:Rieske 2Fe-2S domain-containing protein n=1 Tax=Rhodopila sp. TaxID=2480087 RepID=UPI003D0B3F00